MGCKVDLKSISTLVQLSACRPVIEMTIPSSLDPTLCPEGHHVILLFTMYTPYQLSEGRQWDDKHRNAYADCGECNRCISMVPPLRMAVYMPVVNVKYELRETEVVNLGHGHRVGG